MKRERASILAALAAVAVACVGVPLASAPAAPAAFAPPAGAPPADTLSYELADRWLTQARQAYLADTKRTRSFDDRVVALLTPIADLLHDVPLRVDPAQLERDAWALLRDGCDHPLAKFAFAHVAGVRGGMDECRRPFIDAEAELKKRAYPLEVQLAIAMASGRWSRAHGAPADRALYGRAFEVAGEIIRSDPKGRLELNVIGDAIVELCDAGAITSVKSLVTRARNTKQLDRCLWETIAGCAEVRTAWEARGPRWPSTVPEAKLREFSDHLKGAATHLKEAFRLDPRRPQAPIVLVGVAMSGGTPGEDAAFWLDKALSARADAHRAVVALVAHGVPRVGGSFQRLEETARRFLEAPKDTSRARPGYDTDVPLYYLEVLTRIAIESRGNPEALRIPGTVERVRQVVEGVIARGDRPWMDVPLRTRLAVIAWANRDLELARRTIADLGDEFSERAVASMRCDVREVRQEVAVGAGPLASAIADADALLRKGTPDAAASAQAAFEGLLARAAPGDVDVADALRDRIAQARVAAAIAKDEWIPLTAEPGLPGWRVRAGAWVAGKDGTILGAPRAEGMRLTLAQPLGPRWELTCRLQQRAGLLVECAPPEHSGDRLFRGAMFGDSGWSLLIADDQGGDPRSATALPFGATWTMRVWDDEVVLLQNDRVMYAGPFGSVTGIPAERLALGTLGTRSDRVPMEFKELRVRRLAERPVELETPKLGRSLKPPTRPGITPNDLRKPKQPASKPIKKKPKPKPKPGSSPPPRRGGAS